MAAYRHMAIVFMILEGAVYSGFLYLDLGPERTDSSGIKFLGIVLCLAFALWAAACGGERLVAWAMALTVGADVCLLLLGRWYLAGVVLFCLVQGLYLVRMLRWGAPRPLWTARLVLTALGWVALLQLGMLSPLNAIALLYGANFLCNVLASLELKGGRQRLFSLGLGLFFCCDLCVGIWNAPQLFPAWAGEFSRVGMWAFYLPGQVLIALSTLPQGQSHR